jgi:hypothetical protein
MSSTSKINNPKGLRGISVSLIGRGVRGELRLLLDRSRYHLPEYSPLADAEGSETKRFRLGKYRVKSCVPCSLASGSEGCGLHVPHPSDRVLLAMVEKFQTEVVSIGG